MTPDQEAKANEAANRILAELRAASTPEECAEIGERTAKVFARLQQVHEVRAIHIVALAKMKQVEFKMKREAENKARDARNQAQADLFA